MSDKYAGNELKYLKKVLNSERWSSTEGSWTNSLEASFATRFGAKYAIAMNSGTAVLHAALVACGVRPGDEVITPALTVFMDTSSILHCGGIPIYADIDPNNFTIDPEDVRKRITSNTRAIIAVSLYGHPCDMAALSKIAREFNIYLIVDNAQHMDMQSGHITTYSFENSKHLSCGEGGIVLTNDEYLAAHMRKLSNHGFKNSTADEGRTKLNMDDFQNPHYKRHSVVGWNYRMSEFSAAIALAQLENVDSLVKKRQYAADKFRNIVAGCEWIIPQQYHSKHTYWTFVVKYVNSLPSWKKFRSIYLSHGGDGIYGAWSVPYLEPVMQKGMFKMLNPYVYENIQYQRGICPIAESIQPTLMQFKTNYWDSSLADLKTNALKMAILHAENLND